MIKILSSCCSRRQQDSRVGWVGGFLKLYINLQLRSDRREDATTVVIVVVVVVVVDKGE